MFVMDRSGVQDRNTEGQREVLRTETQGTSKRQQLTCVNQVS